jgi:diguanylate cyclase (GGDEF)-like protein
MKKYFFKTVSFLLIIIVLIMLYLSSKYNYLLFHTIVEIFTVCIAFTVFIISWNASRYVKNNYLMIIGIAYFFIAFIDLFHTMSYKGMNIIRDYDYYANQLWIAARYMESISLLAAFAYVKSRKRVNAYVLLTIYTAVTALIMLSIFAWKIFPICFIDGSGLTAFKTESEYTICLILLLAILILIKNKNAFEVKIYRFLLLSMACTIFSELAFTEYVDNYGILNLVGHYFKGFSFYLIYKTIVVKCIQEPYEIIFREMKQTERNLFEQNELLKDQAAIDGLTGLYNHRHIYERLEEEVKRCSLDHSTFTVMILDIDHFKNVNDTYGHLKGDQILRELSILLKENVRQANLVGRYGGEEFLIMLAQTHLSEGFEAAEKIRRVIEMHEFLQSIRITVSIGVEEYHGEKISELLEKADQKLYAAKNSGRNKTVM